MGSWEEALRAKLLPGEGEPSPDRRSAAVALVLRPRRELEGLFIRRAHREGDPWSGQVGLPGGFRTPEDASLEATARREAREEVGLDVEGACRLLGCLPPLRPANRSEVEVFPFVYALRREVPVAARHEVTEVFWVPLTTLRASSATRRVREGGRELVVPAYRHEGRVIWGLTHRILTAFFEGGLPDPRDA